MDKRQNGKPPILEVLRDYYGITPRISGERGYCKSIFQYETKPSMVIYIEQNRFHDFSSGYSGDSWDLLQMATGRNFSQLQEQYCPALAFEANLRRKSKQEWEEQYRQKVKNCRKRLSSLLRQTFDVEDQFGHTASDDSLERLANAYFLRGILEEILDLMDDSNTEEDGLKQATERGLFDG